MTRRRGTKFVHEGEYVAAVEVEWLESEAGWSPYLSWQDAQKLDEVRGALRRRDLKAGGNWLESISLLPSPCESASAAASSTARASTTGTWR